MIAWEDRDDAGRVALHHYVKTGRATGLATNWSEILLSVVALAISAPGWLPLVRTALSWI
jgi:hypothetical protein